MSDLLAARSQMAMSLAFHIVFAVAGMGMPLLMALSEWRWLRGGQEVDLLLAKRWAKGTAVLFAVGAVSGTVLSFELGLLWPKFMSWAGAIIGMPFSLEGFAFFAEAIFLGIYLYGWDRVPPRAHLAAGVVIAVSGAASMSWIRPLTRRRIVVCVMLRPCGALQTWRAAGSKDTVCIQTCKHAMLGRCRGVLATVGEAPPAFAAPRVSRRSSSSGRASVTTKIGELRDQSSRYSTKSSNEASAHCMSSKQSTVG